MPSPWWRLLSGAVGGLLLAGGMLWPGAAAASFMKQIGTSSPALGGVAEGAHAKRRQSMKSRLRQTPGASHVKQAKAAPPAAAAPSTALTSP